MRMGISHKGRDRLLGTTHLEGLILNSVVSTRPDSILQHGLWWSVCWKLTVWATYNVGPQGGPWGGTEWQCPGTRWEQRPGMQGSVQPYGHGFPNYRDVYVVGGWESPLSTLYSSTENSVWTQVWEPA